MASEKEFGAKIALADYEEFKKNFPQYGATNWLINSAVREVNRLVKEDSAAKDIVQKAIQNLLNDRRVAKQ